MAARSTKITLHNKTDNNLIRTNEHLSHGVWADSSTPHETINKQSSSSWQSNSDGFMTGTAGTVSYNIEHSTEKITIDWSNPFISSNSYSSKQPTGYKLKKTSGGKGNNATVVYTMSKS